jgi:predicted PurR-regulated permease PerM
MPQSCERKIIIDTWTILKVIGILLFVGFLYLVRDIIVLLFVALFLAALMHPAAKTLARFKIPKGLTVLGIYLLIIGTAALIVVLLLPSFLEQTSNLLDSFGVSWQTLGDIKASIKQLTPNLNLTENINQLLTSGQLTKAAGGLFSTVTFVFGGIVGLVLALVMAYYAVAEEQEAHNVFQNLVPDKYQEVSAVILKRVEEKIGRWLVGQLALGFIIGVFYYVGLSLIGVKSALVLAVFGGFMEFIPYIGPILVGIPIIIIALSQSPLTAALALVIQIAIQQLENHVIVPKVMQKAVGLNPLVSIVALLVGAKLFGIVGMLLAIPVTTSISVVLTEIYRFRKGQKTS